MFKFTLTLRNGSTLSCTSKYRTASAWYLFWSNGYNNGQIDFKDVINSIYDGKI